MTDKRMQVKFTIPTSFRDEITRYLEAEAAAQSEVITTAVREAVDAFDFEAAVQVVCETELRKFVADAAAAYFRALLKSKDAHQVVRDALRTQMGETQ